MKRLHLLCWCALFANAGCMLITGEFKNVPGDDTMDTGGTDSDSGVAVDTEPLAIDQDFDGVDILVVVDNSSSMSHEQEILSTSLFTLINSLVNPLPAWPYPPMDDVRIAFTTSDMGLQWGGNAFDPDNDGWPGGAAPEGCTDPRGNNGSFITDYTNATVDLQSGVIACGGDPDPDIQCPTGWTCENINGEGIGVCEAPGGDGDQQSCPDSPESVGRTYLDLDSGNWSSADLAFATACMTNVGTTGCMFEQQLVAAARGLNGDGIDTGFMRENSLMVVLVVSDEEDCSMEDGPSLFASEEVQDQYKRNIACGMNQQFLYSAAEIKQMYADAKARVSDAGKAAGAVLFAAIVGVPYEGDGATACQGKGSEIADCLDFELEEGTMGDPGTVTRLPPNTTSGPEATYFEYACERFDGDTPITQAYPGTRYVALAQEYRSLGYVYSICNPDWTKAMEDIARMIASSRSSGCRAEPLAFDAAAQTSFCDVVMTFSGAECPSLERGEWGVMRPSADKDDPRVDCTLPRIPLSLACWNTSLDELTDIQQSRFGWFYCENRMENFADACSDGADNDGDGDVDCDDSECSACGNCAEDADPLLCPDLCRYETTLTQSARSIAESALAITLHCPVE